MKKKFLNLLAIAMISVMAFSEPSTNMSVENLTLTSADTEYSIEIPKWTKAVTIQCRTAYALRMAVESGVVAEPDGEYWTVKANGGYYDSDILGSQTLYFASSEAGVVVEFIFWAQ